MPTLQVRDLPEDVYHQIDYLAEKERRSIAQETIVLLEDGLLAKLGNKARRKRLLESIEGMGIDGVGLPDPVQLVRKDRER